MKRSELLQSSFSAWHDQAIVFRKLRSKTISTWKDYSMRLLTIPFKTWFLWTCKAKIQRISDNSIVQASIRRQNYRLSHKVFKYWKHQALFGKVDGMRSRMELIAVLDDQRQYSVFLNFFHIKINS